MQSVIKLMRIVGLGAILLLSHSRITLAQSIWASPARENSVTIEHFILSVPADSWFYLTKPSSATFLTLRYRLYKKAVLAERDQQ